MVEVLGLYLIQRSQRDPHILPMDLVEEEPVVGEGEVVVVVVEVGEQTAKKETVRTLQDHQAIHTLRLLGHQQVVLQV